MAAAEETREEPPQPLIRLVERLLETRAGFPIYLSDRLLERLERFGEIRELRVEVLLALGLLLELVDRGEIDRPKALDLPLDRFELLVPGGRRRILGKIGEDLLELEAVLLKLLGDGLEPELRLPRRESHRVRRLACGGHGLLRIVAALLELAKLSIERFDGLARFGELRLDGGALIRKTRQLALVIRLRLHRRFELALQLLAALRQMLLLSEHSGERGA